MKKLSPLIISTLLLVSGCGVFGGGGGDDLSNITPIPPQQTTPEEENSEEVTMEENNAVENQSAVIPNALIPSTNPSQRLNQITQGRGDPFGSIRPPAIVRIPVTQPVPESAMAKAIVREPIPPAPEPGETTNGLPPTTTTQNGTGQTNNLGVLGADGQRFDADGKIVPYVPPEPTEAKSIVVSGIVDLQGQNVALVTTPWDNTTRRVRVGDTLFSQDSGVSIRVKEINFSFPQTIALREDNQIIYRNISDSNGVVVLEQYGQQVRKEILGNPEIEDKSNS